LNSGKRHETLKKLHDKYGLYVRIGALVSMLFAMIVVNHHEGPNELSCTDVDAFPHVLGPDGLPKGPRTSFLQLFTHPLSPTPCYSLEGPTYPGSFTNPSRNSEYQ
jgi:hypothetical protein